MGDFCHLHCHTHYSLLDGAADIAPLMDKALADGQSALALTDHGNMFGAFKFVAEANKRGIMPIVGCEFYLVADRRKQSFLKSKGEKDERYHQLLLAKNQKGYENLSKLCSLGFIEGMYGKYPRIDKELLIAHHEGLIATSCCLAAEIPRMIASGNLDKAEESLRWWLEIFGEDYYIEIQRHAGLENLDGGAIMGQDEVNSHLVRFAKKYNVKVIATNDSHYVNEEDWLPHDIILCVNTGVKRDDLGRFKFSSSDYYLKSRAEMYSLFSDMPEVLANTMEIVSKIEAPQLARDILLPSFPLPQSFTKQGDYLRYLVYEGASRLYGEISSVLKERLDFELGIIADMDFEGYFLIVQDFIQAARELGVSVGPGRGSAAGSAVAYCLRITNIDPLKYNLLFERFLNPERVSMPDIDIDFDDYGRQKVIDWVVDKYGKNQVAQIITFGTMAARSSIRDVGRVLSLELSETDKIAKLVPSRPGTKLKSILFDEERTLSDEWQGDDLSRIKELRSYLARTDLMGEVVRVAAKVEGTVRNTGVHAAGLIIAPSDITALIPVCTSNETDLLLTQFEGSVVEDAGMLKMDFLGLKTLSIIKDAIENVVLRYGDSARLDPDEIPLDDRKTFELFQNGDMVGIFQFESDGMRKFLKELKPTSMEDLIAMNALYRPGPMENIPSFIRRKHGTEPIDYPHEWLVDLLSPTYGIMVYQEQIMQTAQLMADYSLGKADLLRRAMGKKKKSEMEKQRQIFAEGCLLKGVNEEKANEIFDTMEKFAQYGFNRSHAAAYSVLAFQTAYLKTHYPAEYMASVLTHNKQDITKLNFFLREVKRMDIVVLGPDVNESELNFTVNRDGHIRFGLSALKGLGEGPVNEIIEQRQKTGKFTSLFDLTKKLNLRSLNKKSLESLVDGGALDSFNNGNRAQFYAPLEGVETVIEYSLKFGNTYQSQKQELSNSLFGDLSEILVKEPLLPNVTPWSRVDQLNREKEVTGIYITGHPLDDYQLELENYINCTIDEAAMKLDTPLQFAGMVTETFHGVTQKGLGYGKFTIQDYKGSMQISLYNEGYKSFKDLINKGEVLYVEGSNSKGYNSDNYFFRVKSIRLLDTVGKTMTKSITIQLPLEELREELVTSLKTILHQHKGHHQLKLVIKDNEEEIDLQMIGNKKGIEVNNSLLEKLSVLGLQYKLN